MSYGDCYKCECGYVWTQRKQYGNSPFCPKCRSDSFQKWHGITNMPYEEGRKLSKRYNRIHAKELEKIREREIEEEKSYQNKKVIIVILKLLIIVISLRLFFGGMGSEYGGGGQILLAMVLFVFVCIWALWDLERSTNLGRHYRYRR
jgi:hypothetical protein